MNDFFLLAADVRPIVSRPSRRIGLAPDLCANFLDAHSDAVRISQSGARIFQKESGHVAVDRTDPIVWLEPVKRAHEDRLLVMRGVKRAAQSATLLFFYETNIEVTREVEMREHLEALFTAELGAIWAHLGWLL